MSHRWTTNPCDTLQLAIANAGDDGLVVALAGTLDAVSTPSIAAGARSPRERSPDVPRFG